MSPAQPGRAATLSRVLAWVAAVVVASAGCSGLEPASPDAATADVAVVDADTDAASADVAVGDADTDAPSAPTAEEACVAKNSACLNATWTTAGTCKSQPKTGAPCGATASPCGGICTDTGTCVLPGADFACDDSGGQCAHCDGAGQCAVFAEGATCTPSGSTGQCLTKTGTCGADGTCKLAIAANANCQLEPGPCGVGICTGSGTCARASEGLPCSGASGICQKSDGTCDANGKCVGAADKGAKCTIGESFCGSGICSAEAACVLQKTGTACTGAPKQVCRKLSGLCGTRGQCVGDVDVGAACPDKPGQCSGICNKEGACVSGSGGVGGVCTVEGGPCVGQLGVCSSGGSCLGIGECTTPPYDQQQWDAVLSCVKIPFVCKQEWGCEKLIPSLPATNSGTCGDAGDPCKPKFCKISDNDKQLSCATGQLNDGTPCPSDATNPCAASTCQAGTCTAAFKPAGTVCKPPAPGICGEFQCSSAGKCESVPTSVPLAAPCTISDGDTDCWAKSCDSLGNCTKTPRAKGEHCGIYPDNDCANFACNGKGDCLIELKADKGTCSDARCSAPNAMPGSPCTGGPCIESSCTTLGKCSTKYKPVGSSCAILSHVGVCNEDHTCVLPAEAVISLQKVNCWGTFPCMKEDVTYRADGLCHGTVALGSACGTVCNPGVCGLDGTCQKAFAPKGLSCGAKYECGSLVCDGKGGCSVDPSNVGKTCKGAEPWECAKYACNIYGGCSLVPTPGIACTATGPCTKGICNAEGFCGQEPLTGPDCPLSGSNPCELGTCQAGKCQPGAKPGASCVKNSQCQEYVCGPPPFGKCAYKAKVGTPCASKGQCTKGICGTFGQCTQVPNPGAKCEGDAPCTAGTCNAAGKCDAAPKPAGSKCTAVAPAADWDCYTGECDASSTCKLKINVGASCKKGDGPCTKGVCQSDASCKAVPANVGQPMCNTTCGWLGTCGPAGECVGKGNPGAACYPSCMVNAKCTDTGQCVGTATPGAPCDGPLSAGLCTKRTCDSDAACTAKPLSAGTPCTVGLTETGALSAYPCGSATGSCNGSGKCVPAAVDPDGTPCGVDDGCALAHVCKAGLCIPVAPKPEYTPCIYGCASGHCSAGGCVAQTTLASQTSGSCSDGIECTYDFCWGSPLAGPTAQFNDGLYGGTFSPGKCAIRDKSSNRFSTCPNGKQVNSCKDNTCATTPCGQVKVCKFDKYDWVGYCVLSDKQPNVVYQVNYMCSDGDPCSTDYCDGSGECKHGVNGALAGKSCGPFKQCQGGKCVPWN